MMINLRHLRSNLEFPAAGEASNYESTFLHDFTPKNLDKKTANSQYTNDANTIQKSIRSQALFTKTNNNYHQ